MRTQEKLGSRAKELDEVGTESRGRPLRARG